MTGTALSLEDQLAAAQATIQSQAAQIASLTTQANTAAISQYTGLVPDLTKVQASSLTAASGTPLFADLISYHALEYAADAIATKVDEDLKPVPTRGSILVTNDTALAVSDSIYRALCAQLQSLQDQATKTLAQTRYATASTSRHVGEPQPAELSAFAPGTLLGVGGAVAAAIPGILSLFSAQRTVASSEGSTDDLALAACLIGRLKHPHEADNGSMTFHDTIRLLPADSPTLDALAELARATDGLVAVSLDPDTTGTLKLEVTAVLQAIQQFIAAINTVPSGATNTPLTTSLLREQLHREQPERLTHVLVASAKSDSTSGSTDHRMFRSDRFTTIGTATASYFLLDVETGSLIGADTVTRTATVSGKIGETMMIDPVRASPS